MSMGTDVQVLQILLNSHGFPVSQTGPGSPGNETTYFGAKTWQALVNFQKSAGIVPARGYFGPITRAYVKNLIP
jgi:peptidoglycan hydrolase-like protein with peptidoglycan-binding domain